MNALEDFILRTNVLGSFFFEEKKYFKMKFG